MWEIYLIPDRPSPPNYDGMTAAKADDAKKRYSIDRQKFREELRRERLRAAKGGLFDEKDCTVDLTPIVHCIQWHRSSILTSKRDTHFLSTN